jgi:hypothetical protein
MSRREAPYKSLKWTFRAERSRPRPCSKVEGSSPFIRSSQKPRSGGAFSFDDAVRLGRQAIGADVEVTLDITPHVPHVFQAYHSILDEATTALDRAGQLLSAHLAGAQRVTASPKPPAMR